MVVIGRRPRAAAAAGRHPDAGAQEQNQERKKDARGYLERPQRGALGKDLLAPVVDRYCQRPSFSWVNSGQLKENALPATEDGPWLTREQQES